MNNIKKLYIIYLIIALIFGVIILNYFFLEDFNNNNDILYEHIVLIPHYTTIGDTFSVIGMIFFLLKYYKNIYLCTKDNATYMYFLNFFHKCPLINKRIFVSNLLNNEFEDEINNSKIGSFHICNASSSESFFYNNSKINKEFYFNNDNPFYNKLPIEDKYIHSPPYRIGQETPTINHINHYNYLGLNNTVRMYFFDYTRDHEKEQVYKRQILEKNNLSETDKYNIIYSAGQSIDYENLKKYNKNDYITIDIHNLVDFPGWLFLLIEEAECVNLVEGSTCNFIYQSQYKKIINLNMPIYFHIWLRNRNWLDRDLYLLEGWKMMTEPILTSWTFIYEDI